MSEANPGATINSIPGCRFAHPGYDICLLYVMAGLVPAIHVFFRCQDVDARHEGRA
jgi:hypothetical protein